MARPINRLSARTVQAIREPGRHADGAGLYLHVESPELKRWVFVYQWQGRRRELGLGKISLVTLAEARATANEASRMVYAGKDPMLERRTRKQAAAPKTFATVASSVLATLEIDLGNAKHLAQWRRSLEVHAAPLSALPINAITTEDVLAVLTPLWSATPETASRTRGRIERVLDAAKAKGLRAGENPARWRGHLSLLLAKRPRLAQAHHAAMPFDEVADFMEKLRSRPAVAARSLEFLILTAARTGEVVGATWDEFDLAAAVWTIPAARMKARAEHRVPLSKAALSVLTNLRGESAETPGANDYDGQNSSITGKLIVFPGSDLRRSLSNMAMEMLLRRMGYAKWTVHGFRSTFRDWAGEISDYPREIIEAALAHTIGNAVERAYRRGDALEKRRKLMIDWAKHCGYPESDSASLEATAYSAQLRG